MAIYKNRPVVPRWDSEGKGGNRSICKIYGLSTTIEEVESFFTESNFTLNSYDKPFSFGYGILKSEATGKFLDLEECKVSIQANGVRYNEVQKENAQGPYYEVSLEIDPDSDSVDRWLQSLNSHQRPTIFVILYSQGGGRVIGNQNGAMVFGEKYDAGGRKRVQGRDIKYQWDCHHPSYFLEDTDVFVPDAYIRAKCAVGIRFSDLATAITYFDGKFDHTPFGHIFDINQVWFRLPHGSKIINPIFEAGVSSDFEFEDKTGYIVGMESVTGAFVGLGVGGNDMVWMENLTIKNCEHCFKELKYTELNIVRLSENNDDCFVQIYESKFQYINYIEKINAISSNMFKQVDRFVVSKEIHLPKFTTYTASFQILGTNGGYASIAKIKIEGRIAVCFHNSIFNIGVFHSIFNSGVASEIQDSFIGCILTIDYVFLFGQLMDNSFKNNQNVLINSAIETCNTPTTTYIQDFFNFTTNLKIRGKIGTSFQEDKIGTEGFKNCTGLFEFKTGYNTINAGGVEGDVAQIIANGTPISVLYNQ